MNREKRIEKKKERVKKIAPFRPCRKRLGHLPRRGRQGLASLPWGKSPVRTLGNRGIVRFVAEGDTDFYSCGAAGLHFFIPPFGGWDPFCGILRQAGKSAM